MKAILESPFVRALGAVIVIFIIGCIFNADGAFFRWSTHRDMLRQCSVYGILACGMTLVILTGGIDLAVGSLLGLTSVAFSMLLIFEGWSPFGAVLATLGLGLLCGAVSGSIVAGFRVQPFIATLAMMVFARGLAKWLSGGEKVSTYSERAMNAKGEIPDTPAIFDFIDSRPDAFGGNISVVTLIFFACVLFCWFFVQKTIWGRYILAIGGNEQAAQYSGVRVGRIKILAYALGGFFSAVAGICQAAQELQGDPEAGSTYELTAIAMVVIGGTSLMGGRGGVLLTLIGTLTIGYLEKILSLNAIEESVRLMLTGGIIVGAVLFQKNKRA